MSAPNVTVNRTNGGIGRQANGSDYYSGYLHYVRTGFTLPTALDPGAGGQSIRSINSITDLISLGIDGTSADEIQATFTSALTKGSTGDTISFTFTDPLTSQTTVLCNYTQVSGDSSNPIFASSVAAAITANTTTTGFSASASSNTLTIITKKGYGVLLNTGTPITSAVTGSVVVGTITLGVSGEGSEQDIIYYHVREAFRVQGILNGKAQGQIWVGVYNITASPSTYANFTEVATMQSYTNGQIKQLGVYATTAAFATSHVTALNAQAVALAAQNQPLAIIYQGNFKGAATVPVHNLLALNSQFVQCTYGQDGGNVGNLLFIKSGKSIGSVGTTLGAWALAGVQQSIISRAVFNVVDSLEFTKLAWANGALLSASGAGLSATIDAVDALGYVFLRNESSPVSSALFGGVFFNNDSMSVTQTSDYAYMPNIRTINKAAVGVRAAILLALGGHVYFNGDRT